MVREKVEKIRYAILHRLGSVVSEQPVSFPISKRHFHVSGQFLTSTLTWLRYHVPGLGTPSPLASRLSTAPNVQSYGAASHPSAQSLRHI